MNSFFISFIVKGKDVGRFMDKSTFRKGLKTSPVVFSKDDSVATRMLKALISQMISMEPEDRPSAEEVLEQLLDVAGEDYLRINALIFIEIVHSLKMKYLGMSISMYDMSHVQCYHM